MQYVEIHNPQAQLLVDWMARQARARDVMIRRLLVPWHVRKQPESAAFVRDIDAILKQNARNYAKSAP